MHNEKVVSLSVCPSPCFISKTLEQILVKFSTGGSTVKVVQHI